MIFNLPTLHNICRKSAAVELPGKYPLENQTDPWNPVHKVRWSSKIKLGLMIVIETLNYIIGASLAAGFHLIKRFQELIQTKNNFHNNDDARVCYVE